MMRNTVSNYTLLVLAIFIIALAAFFGIRNSSGQTNQARNGTASEERAVVEAIRRGGLREAAKIKGHYTGTINTSRWLKYTLEALTKNSAVIVVANAVSNVGILSPDERRINTNYQVIVREGLKGNLQEGTVITVSVPGGRVDFQDGTSAEQLTPGFTRMENGRSYVLFLSESGANDGSFSLTGGPQGQFEIPADGTGIRPSGDKVDEVQKHKGKNPKSFLKEIREASRNWPGPANCCK